MLRAAFKLLLMGIVVLTLVSAVSAAPARQASVLNATIVSFNADASAVSYADVEAGSAQVTLAWQTVNTNGQYRLVLDTYQQNHWVSILGENEALPLNGTKLVNVAHPQNFGVPTYRLTLKTSLGEMMGQQFLTLPYAAAAQAAPEIVSFTTPVQNIDTNLLVQENARLLVNWEIANRPANSLIRFDQVLPDGSTISAELPRALLWVPSSGEGAVVPRQTASKADVQFRMSVVNPVDGTVYDEAEFTLPVVGDVVQAPPLSADQGQASAFVPISGTGINTFSAAPETAADGSLTLNWDAGDAESVQLLQSVPEGGTTLYIELPPSGSMTIPADAPAAIYTLRAESATGEVSTGELTITPEGAQGQ
ncbi:MAG: hypothetical protein ABI835_22280 [Chloroflexota bacterium]